MNALFSKRRRPVQEAVGQFLLLTSFIGALIYGCGWFPSTWIWPVIAKGSAVGLLAIFVLVGMQSMNHFLLLLALVASVGGDVLLAIPHADSFTRGLTSFLITHVIFIILYLKNRMLAEDITAARVRIIVILWLMVAGASYLLYPHVGDMMVPVFGYSAALAAMATTALLSKYPAKLVGLGALLFVLSDAVLGARQFFVVPEFTAYIVWATYYLAQLLMTLGVMTTDERPTHYGGYRFD